MPAGNLKVIFHGLFAFVVHGECIEVLIPEVPAVGAMGGHVYRASTVAAPVPAPPDARVLALEEGMSYRLSGVGGEGSITRFPRESFPVVEGYRTIDRTPSRLHGSIYLPFPKSVTGLRRLKPGGLNYFDGAAAAQITAESIPLIYVLTYTVANSAYLDEWQIQSNTLHIFAEAETQNGTPPDHAFSRLVRLFPALDLKLIERDWADLENMEQGNRVKVTAAEGRSLGEPAANITLQQQNRAVQPAYPLCISLVVDNS